MAITQIGINYEKCTTPFDCKKCLQVCPQAIFRVVPVKQVKFQETDAKEPGAWRLLVSFGDKCTICNRCLKVCPVDALTVTQQ